MRNLSFSVMLELEALSLVFPTVATASQFFSGGPAMLSNKTQADTTFNLQLVSLLILRMNPKCR